MHTIPQYGSAPTFISFPCLQKIESVLQKQSKLWIVFSVHSCVLLLTKIVIPHLGRFGGGEYLPRAIDANPNSNETIQLARAVADFLHRNSGLLQHTQQQVVERRVFRIDDVAIAFDLSRASARKDDRQVVMRVEVAVADAAAVKDQRMIEQIVVSVGRRFQPLDQIGEEFDVLLVDLRYLGDLLRVVLMVSEI